MKRIFFLLGLLVLLASATTKDNPDPRYAIIDTPICWNTGGVDSNLVRYTLVSSRSSTPIDLMYVNAQGNTVSLGENPTLQNGWCCDGSGGSGGGSVNNIYTASDSIQDTRRKVAMELNFDDANEQMLSFGEFAGDNTIDMLLNLTKTYYDNRGLYMLPGLMGFTESYAGLNFQYDIAMGEEIEGVLLQAIDDSDGGEGEIFVAPDKVGFYHNVVSISGNHSVELSGTAGFVIDTDSTGMTIKGDAAKFTLENLPNTRDDADTATVSNYAFTNSAGQLLVSKQAIGQDTLGSGNTSVVVTHGIGRVPNNITITPLGNLGTWWVSSITSTQFTLNVAAGPGGDVVFQYNAK